MLYKLFAPGLMKMDIRFSADWMRKQTWMTLMICFVYTTKVGWQHSYVFYTAISEKKNIKNEKGGMKLKSIINFLQCLSPAECQFYSMVIQLFKLILVMPATIVR